MPWKAKARMDLRKEFVTQAIQTGSNIRKLCREYEITARTGYKWITRYKQEGETGLADQSRRPIRSPKQTNAEVEERVIKAREQHPAWGGRKLKAYLEQSGGANIPSSSTITAILRRNGQIDELEADKHRPFQRFERSLPNELWQMDFKGYFGLSQGGYCHPLTILDDHSRFLVGLKACSDERFETVQSQLSEVFRCYGLPDTMLMDNGSPWGDGRYSHYTILTTWLMRLDIRVTHGRPYHPQTQGKDERLHRTLKAELLTQKVLTSLADCQIAFDQWRDEYNQIRPHESLQLQPPCLRYASSNRLFPEVLPPIVYPADFQIRKVDDSGKFYFQNRIFRIGKAFRHFPIALTPTYPDGCYDVYFANFRIHQISVRDMVC